MLNFLIGKDILPASVFETKSFSCRLRYGTEKSAKLIDVSGNVIEDIKYDENDTALNRLSDIIEGNESVPDLSYVDIFLNEASLEVRWYTGIVHVYIFTVSFLYSINNVT